MGLELEAASACFDRTLLEAFPRTIDAWQNANPARTTDDLAAAFAGSRHFEAYRARASSRRGISLEEAFFRFCGDERIGDPATRKGECGRAVIWALAAGAAPSFDPPDFVLRAPRGHFVIVEEDQGLTLVAAIDCRLVTGRVTPFLAELLSSGDSPSFVAMRFDISPAELAASCNVLRRMGLIA